MYRIKTYFKKHPKLMRIVKIFGVISIVFSFLFNGLIIGSLIINANRPLDNKTFAYVDYIPTTKNLIQERYAVYYNYGDFMSPLFAEETFNYLTSLDNIGLTGKGKDDFLSGDIIYINSNDMLYGTLDNSGDHISWSQDTITSFKVQYDTTTSYPTYILQFTRKTYNRSEYVSFLFQYRRYSLYNENNELTFFNWSSCLQLDFSTDGVTWSSVLPVYATYSDNYFAVPKNSYFNWIGTGETKFNDYYNNGYNDGYQLGLETGENSGYEDGYNIGYYDGLQNAEQGETTMFTLITRAFNAVASILDIQVLPNLSLGLLIFTPLIVTIIIVIVKMVKG